MNLRVEYKPRTRWSTTSVPGGTDFVPPGTHSIVVFILVERVGSSSLILGNMLPGAQRAVNRYDPAEQRQTVSFDRRVVGHN